KGSSGESAGKKIGSLASMSTMKPVKKNFIPNAYHEDVVDETLGQQKKGDVEIKSSSSPSTDNRLTWATNLITRRPIRVLAKEFSQNKKIKPTEFTTEAYEKNDAKNR
ncbi:hypothetical protein KIN20_001341, partial [Parelaphostrongylus tenuis]